MRVSEVLGGTVIATPSITGFLSSDFDPFLNQLFAGGGVTASHVARALAGHPGFVWLAEDAANNVGDLAGHGLMLAVMHGMTATTAPIEQVARPACEIVEVRSSADLDAWLEVYLEVFGADPSARDDWCRVHDALGPRGDGSLLLLLATADNMAAATAAAVYQHDVAGLYCFTTREWARRRGLASTLLHAVHSAARERGIEQAVLHATDLGQPVYTAAGYRKIRSLPVVVSRLSRS
jgi:ribosomal protein S18 acetylase RimI-like enzyme